jgi:hypothetical protein
MTSFEIIFKRVSRDLIWHHFNSRIIGSIFLLFPMPNALYVRSVVLHGGHIVCSQLDISLLDMRLLKSDRLSRCPPNAQGLTAHRARLKAHLNISVFGRRKSKSEDPIRTSTPKAPKVRRYSRPSSNDFLQLNDRPELL